MQEIDLIYKDDLKVEDLLKLTGMIFIKCVFNYGHILASSFKLWWHVKVGFRDSKNG